MLNSLNCAISIMLGTVDTMDRYVLICSLCYSLEMIATLQLFAHLNMQIVSVVSYRITIRGWNSLSCMIPKILV